eukprot:1790108-Karenia_brevis.AAC.1
MSDVGAIITANMHSGWNWMAGSCATGRHGCTYTGMGQNKPAFWIDQRSLTTSVSSDSDSDNEFAFPPSDDDEACAAFIKEI